VTRPGRLTPARVLGDYRSFLAAQPALRAIIRAGLPFESGTGQFTEELPPELPVTIAWARRDLVLPPSHAAVARARIPQATHVMLPHCGHVPMSDDPELVARVLLRGSERGVNPDVVSDGDRHAG
jgi:pimeloyl-ACP methyl ester carboxylesterase